METEKIHGSADAPSIDPRRQLALTVHTAYYYIAILYMTPFPLPLTHWIYSERVYETFYFFFYFLFQFILISTLFFADAPTRIFFFSPKYRARNFCQQILSIYMLCNNGSSIIDTDRKRKKNLTTFRFAIYSASETPLSCQSSTKCTV